MKMRRSNRGKRRREERQNDQGQELPFEDIPLVTEILPLCPTSRSSHNSAMGSPMPGMPGLPTWLTSRFHTLAACDIAPFCSWDGTLTKSNWGKGF